ncbi:hypothetical protein N1851_026170 [Merluccius polli]|uniref:HECT domain-containing protein n=1 Tax=Merluccius polli TaxID=89951 RepID=A0AA47MCA9_MERPO|nr:hypothetical protein N1851_026170 [Merluccius polli]
MRAILASRFFVGPDDSKHLSLDSIGVGPYVFSERLLCQLTGEPAPPVDVMEIDDEDLKTTIQEVHAAIASAASNLALLGSLTVIRSMSDTDEVVESALKFYLENRLHVPLQQWRCCVGGGGQGEQSDAEPAPHVCHWGGQSSSLGFPGEPTLNFLHTGTVFPEANTCALILKLPLHTTYESFSDSMISGIIQSPCFGYTCLM